MMDYNTYPIEKQIIITIFVGKGACVKMYYEQYVPMYRSGGPNTRRPGRPRPGYGGGIGPLAAGLLGAGLGFFGGELLHHGPGFGPGFGPGYGPGFGAGYGPGYGPGYQSGPPGMMGGYPGYMGAPGYPSYGPGFY